MNYISEHAIKRFKERYNMELPHVNYFVVNGHKQIAYNKNGKVINNENRGIYRTVLNGQVVEYVMSFHKNGDIVICTFNVPPENLEDPCYSYRRAQ